MVRPAQPNYFSVAGLSPRGVSVSRYLPVIKWFATLKRINGIFISTEVPDGMSKAIMTNL